jgi:hypothetical protein
VQVECLVNVIENLVSSDAPQEQLHRFTHALHQVFAFGRSKKHMIQRQLGRKEEGMHKNEITQRACLPATVLLLP